MKRCLFIILLFLPAAGMSQVTATGWSNVFVAEVNLAFGPNTTATWDPSLGCRIQISDHFRVGVGDLSYGSADLLSGTRNAIMLGPVVEYLIPYSDNLSYSILAGLPVQDRWGANINHAFGVAPYGCGSVDFHFAPNFALAGTLRVQYIASEAYLRTPRVLPSSAFVAALGVGFHFFF